MSLLADAQALAKRPGGTCGVALLVRRLSEQEQAELEDLLWTKDEVGRYAANSKAAARVVSASLQFPMEYQTIQRHRRGDCSCPS